MQKKELPWMPSSKQMLRAMVLLLATPILQHCANQDQGKPLGIPTGSGNFKTIPCVSVKPVSPNRGKPGGPSTEDIEGALNRDHPIDRVRNLVGDTSSTLRQIDSNNAAIKAVCRSSQSATDPVSGPSP